MPNDAHPWSKARADKRRRSPFPGKTMDGRMPTTTAKLRHDCALCDLDVKAGQRVAKHFASDSWVHVGCLVRTTYGQPALAT